MFWLKNQWQQLKDLNELYLLAKKSKKFLIAAPFVILSYFQAIHQELEKKQLEMLI